MKSSLVLGALLVFAISGCTSAPHISDEPMLELPRRETTQAEGLLRLLYLSERSRYSLRYSPEGNEGLRQATRELKTRVAAIREAAGKVGFRAQTCGPQGEALTERKGIFDPEHNVFHYQVDEQEHDDQPLTVWLQFLDWHDDRSVISFTEQGSDPWTAEHFVIPHGSRQFTMTLSAPYVD